MFDEASQAEQQEKKNPLESVGTESDLLDQQLLDASKNAGVSQKEADHMMKLDFQNYIKSTVEYKQTIETARFEERNLKTSALITASNLNKETGTIDMHNIIQMPIYTA